MHFTQRHGLNNDSGMLRFHTVDKYLLNAGMHFSGDRQFVHQVVGLGVLRQRHAQEIITMHVCIAQITNAHRSTVDHAY